MGCGILVVGHVAFEVVEFLESFTEYSVRLTEKDIEL